MDVRSRSSPQTSLFRTNPLDVTDGVWVIRTYSPVSQRRVEKTATMGPDSMLEDTIRSPCLDVEQAADASALIALLSAVGAIPTVTAD